MDEISSWWSSAGKELYNVLLHEVREHFLKMNIEGDVYAYAILSLAEDYPKPRVGDYPIQKVDVAFNRETDIKPENRSDFYYRYSANEWAFYKEDAYPASQATLERLNGQFGELHQTKGPEPTRSKGDKICRSMFYNYDEAEVYYANQLNKVFLNVLQDLRREGILAAKVFTLVWAPDSPDDIFYCSAKRLNPEELFKQFWNEFQDDSEEQDCSVFD